MHGLEVLIFCLLICASIALFLIGITGATTTARSRLAIGSGVFLVIIIVSVLLSYVAV